MKRPITLYWGCRAKRDLYMLEVPAEWQHPDFKFVPVLSDPTPEWWTGRTGFVHRAVMEDFPDMSGVQVYACGAPVVVEAARARLQRGVQIAGRRVLRRFFPDRGGQGAAPRRPVILQPEEESMTLTREMIQDGIAEPGERKSIVKPYVMSHGTMECYSLKESRKFYEEFLGLECVRHAKPAMVVRCGLKFHIVAVEVGDAVHPQNVLNHWGMDVGSKEEVDAAHANALKYKDKYKIRQVLNR